jgi:hypothetical protein
LDKNNLLEFINSDMDNLKKTLGENRLRLGNTVTISEDKLNTIEDKILYIFSDLECKNILPKIKNLRKRSIKSILKEYPEYVQNMAKKKGKLIKEFFIEGTDFMISPERYKDFFNSLIYIFDSIVEDGIEELEIRELKKKNPYGSIQFKIVDNSKYFSIIISDDGQGVDKNKYFKEDNFITMLMLVKQELENLNGTVKVSSIKGSGTSICFTIPYSELNKLEKDSENLIFECLNTTTQNFFKEKLKFDENSITNARICTMEHIKLDKYSFYINVLNSIFNKIIITFNEKMVTELLNLNFFNNRTNIITEAESIETLSEISNQLIGSALSHNTSRISPPNAIYSKSTIKIDYPQVKKQILYVESGQFKITFIAINSSFFDM